MARLEGLIKFSGALGELVAYQRKGKWVVRRRTSLDKKRLKSDPAFRNSRKASQEFGGAATIGKYLRQGWRLFLIKDKDTTLYHRLSSRIYLWIKAGQGTPGSRTFQWSDIASEFEALNLNNAHPPAHFLESLPQLDRVGNELSYNINTSCRNPAATHFKLCMHLCALPQFAWNGKNYAPLASIPPMITVESETLPIDAAATLQGTIQLPWNGAWAYTLALNFYQEVNGASYPLAEHPFTWQAIV